MNKTLFWAFFLTYLLSFDALVRNTVAGSVAFFGSGTGFTIVIFDDVN